MKLRPTSSCSVELFIYEDMRLLECNQVNIVDDMWRKNSWVLSSTSSQKMVLLIVT